MSSGATPRGAALDEREALLRSVRAGKILTPAAPIRARELFAGRMQQLRLVLDAIYQPGQHAVIHGERGVGKTSLANMIGPLLAEAGSQVVTTKVNCDGTDTFGSACRKALEQFYLEGRSHIGFEPAYAAERRALGDSIPEDPRPNDVLQVLRFLNARLALVFDEFDRLPRESARPFTDLAKAVSDYGLDVTLVLVGVAETVDQLIDDHASIERALMQIPMPRMRDEEIEEILSKAAADLQMTFDPEAVRHIVQLSQGLPHYTHAIGLHSVRQALDRRAAQVTAEDVSRGVTAAVANAQHSIKTQYQDAVQSAHREALFEPLLLACALAPKDALGCFQPADLVEPMSVIMGRRYDAATFTRHLQDFSSEQRGLVLVRSGQLRRYRYRFRNPLLQPYVVMRGLADGRLPSGALDSTPRGGAPAGDAS